MLVYSGDHDMVVPHTGTRAWLYDIAQLGGAEEPLRAWMLNGQVGGWVSRRGDPWVGGRGGFRNPLKGGSQGRSRR